MATTRDIKKNIAVKTFWLDDSGLEITYETKVNGRTEIHTIIANPEQAADVLKKIGLIEDYSGAGNEISVEIEFLDKEPVQLYWPDFVEKFTFSQSDAIDVTAQVISDKQISGMLHPVMEDICSRFFPVKDQLSHY